MTGEVHAFPDNIFLHYRPLAELDWRSMAQGQPVRILIAPVVTRELEERKTLHPIKRIRERAAVALKMLHKFLEDGLPCKVRDGVLLDLLAQEPSPEFAVAKHLNLQLADDWLVATVLAFHEAHPETKVLLVTGDLPLIVKARHYQIETVQPLSDQRLPDESDPAEQKIKNLENELRQYKSRAPDLGALFEDGEDHKKFEILQPLPNTESEIQSALKAIKEKHPLTTPEPPPPQTGPNISDVLSEHLVETFRSVTAAMQGFQGDYDTRLKNWYQRYEDYLRETAALKNRERRTILLKVIMVNRGSCPAEDIHLMFHFPEGFELYDEDSLPEPPEEPAPPTPLYSPAMLALPNSLLYAQMPNVPLPPDPHAPKIRKTHSYDVTFHFDSFETAQSFSFTYNIHAANAPLPQSGALHVIIEKQV